MTQFTCPKCGISGGDGIKNPDSPPLYLPLCHICDYRVTMRISNNSIILEDEMKNEIDFMKKQIQEAKDFLARLDISDTYDICVDSFKILDNDYYKELSKRYYLGE